MNTKLNIVFIAALVLSACINEEREQDFVCSNTDSFYARIEMSEGSISKAYADDQLRVLWDADDHISIFNKNTYNQEYSFTGNTGDNSGVFQIVPNDDFITSNPLELIYAVYPFSSRTSINNDGLLTINLPDRQYYREGSFGFGANTMISRGSGNMLTFKNLCGYLTLKLYGNGVSVSSITLRGNNSETIAGIAQVSYLNDSTPTVEFQNGDRNSIDLVMDNPVLLGSSAEEATEFWIVIPPVVFANGFTITVTDDGGNVFEKTTTGSLTISRNARKKMAALQVSTGVKEVTDLSLTGTSNCYIVPSGGSFKIKADVKGNSNEPLSGTPVSAEVLWETFNNDIAPETGDIIKNVQFNSGYILFDATGLSGNALVAVKDVEGNILWSWHLWSTDYNPDYHYDVYSPSKAEMMNRNLGALSNIPGDAKANGLLYQWGRKDPFLGSSSTNKSIQCASTPDGVANQMVSKTTEHGTIAYTTAHPTCFIDINTMDWMVSPDYSLWASEKTIYDPCPVGWKVPPASIYESWQNPSSNDYDNINHGILFGSNYSSPATWYPFSGQIFDSLRDVGKCFDFWTYTNDGSSAVSPHIGGDYIDMTTYYDMSGIGQSVRCVKESFIEGSTETIIDEEYCPGDYVDEYGVNYGQGITLGGITWAPVNCGYKPATEQSKGFPFGKLYQWGRKDGQGYGAPYWDSYDAYEDETIPSIQQQWSGNNEDADANTFYYGVSEPYNWIAQTAQHWNAGTEDNPIKNSLYDPCPDGWRVPTSSELRMLFDQGHTAFMDNGGQPGVWFGEVLFSPATGGRFADNWFHNCGACGRGDSFNYWSSTVEGNYAINMNADAIGTTYKAFGLAVRCCREDAHSVQPVSGVLIDETQLLLFPGDTRQLTATIQPDNASITDVEWSSSDESVAVVSAQGAVNALSAGKSIIKVKTADGGYTASCTITVMEMPYAVDLGLSIMWSSWNLGAASPEGYGEYFSWGETSPKDEYSWANYKWCKGSINTHTKYCYDSNYGYEGFHDNLPVLDLEDDAAHANLGGSWRMPTMEEWNELRNSNNCEWEYETFNGVRGFRITSKKEGYIGNSIFLPAASHWLESTPPDYSTGRGNYWSSSPSKIRGHDAYQVDFMPSGINWTSGQAHSLGFSVRPVCQAEDEYEWVTLSKELLGSTHSEYDYYQALDKPFYFTKLRIDKSVSAGTILWICMLFLSDSNPDFAAYWSQYRKTDIEYGFMGLSSTMYPNSNDENPTSKYYGKEISNSIIEFDFTKLAQDTYIWGYQMNVNLSGVQAYVKKSQ